jgi:hypothetical protein
MGLIPGVAPTESRSGVALRQFFLAAIQLIVRQAAVVVRRRRPLSKPTAAIDNQLVRENGEKRS